MTGTYFPPVQIVDRDRGLIAGGRTKVAIVGAGRGREAAPFGDPEWEVWVLNAIWAPRYDVMMELHPRSVQDAVDMQCYPTISTPCYVIDPAEWAPGEIQHPVRYPIETVLRTFRRRYFTCTFAYMIALALLLEYKTIGLWGCGLFEGTARERLVESPCLNYWLGRAHGMGVDVVEDSMLGFQPQLYGYAYHEEVAEVNRQVALTAEVFDFERGVVTYTYPLDSTEKEI